MKSTSLFMWEKQVNDKSNVSSILLVIRLCINFVQLLDIATGWVIKGINSESAKVRTPESRSFLLKHLNQGVSFGGKSQVKCHSYPAVRVVFTVPYLLGVLPWNHWLRPLPHLMKPLIGAVVLRQWPEVYDSCHTLLHVAQVRQHTNMRELHVKCMQFSHIRVFSDSRNVQKRATKSDTWGHCLVVLHVLCSLIGVLRWNYQ